MPDIADGPGKDLATLIRDARLLKGMTQDQLADAAGVTRQTIIKYESGTSASPYGIQLRAVMLALGVDPREALVALGYVTREEMGLPPRPPAVHPVLTDIQRHLDDERIPQRQRDNLLRGVTSARDVWLDMVRIKPANESPARGRRTPTTR